MERKISTRRSSAVSSVRTTDAQDGRARRPTTAERVYLQNEADDDHREGEVEGGRVPLELDEVPELVGVGGDEGDVHHALGHRLLGGEHRGNRWLLPHHRLHLVALHLEGRPLFRFAHFQTEISRPSCGQGPTNNAKASSSNIIKGGEIGSGHSGRT